MNSDRIISRLSDAELLSLHAVHPGRARRTKASAARVDRLLTDLRRERPAALAAPKIPAQKRHAA